MCNGISFSSLLYWPSIFSESISDLVKQLLYCGRAEVSRPLDGDMAAVAVMAALLLLALMAEVGGDSDTPGDMFPRYQPLLLCIVIMWHLAHS